MSRSRQSRQRKKQKKLPPWLWLAVPLAAAMIAWPIMEWRKSKTVSVPDRPPAAHVMASDKETFAQYAGPESCRSCHEAAYENWKTSHHALAERPVKSSADRPWFDPAQSIVHGSQVSTARVDRGQLQLVTAGAHGVTETFSVERVIGVEPLRQFLIPTEGGRFQATELAADSGKIEWFDVYGGEDRKPGEWGHWTGRGMTWNAMCAECHNTRLRKHYDPGTDSYQTTMALPSVTCEACHGPMADHVKWQRQYGKDDKGDPTLHPLNKEQMLAVCGSCHSRRSEFTGDFHPGEFFADHYGLVIPDETQIYYPDGQVRDEDYEYASFLGSKMHDGGVRCLDCHEPHSSQTILPGNLLCMRCHNGSFTNSPIIDPVSHSHHAPDTAGSFCVDCHMPQTVYMERHARRDHGFTIPDPLLTKELGIPNACNRCHTNRPVEWTLQAAEQWYGKRLERPTRARARTVARARAGDDLVVNDLLTLAHTGSSGLWRAVATGLLRPWTGLPKVTTELLQRLDDEHPLVRTMAVRSVEPYAARPDSPFADRLQQLLKDPVRSVRMEAAWALRSGLEMESRPGRELLSYLRFHLDQPSGQLQMGAFHSDRGNNSKALEHFHRAVAWDPNSGPLRHALAVALSVAGQNAEAVAELQAACRISPRNADYRYSLGLALNEAGNLAEAAAALEEAVRLDPEFAQAWYNLGLAYSAQQNAEKAIEALLRAETLNPNSPQAPYARATILARMGKVEEAQAAARRALSIAPDFAEAARLLQVLQR